MKSAEHASVWQMLVKHIRASKRPESLVETIEDVAIAMFSWGMLVNGMLLLAGVKGPWLLKS